MKKRLKAVVKFVHLFFKEIVFYAMLFLFGIPIMLASHYGIITQDQGNQWFFGFVIVYMIGLLVYMFAIASCRAYARKNGKLCEYE